MKHSTACPIGVFFTVIPAWPGVTGGSNRCPKADQAPDLDEQTPCPPPHLHPTGCAYVSTKQHCKIDSAGPFELWARAHGPDREELEHLRFW